MRIDVHAHHFPSEYTDAAASEVVPFEDDADAAESVPPLRSWTLVNGSPGLCEPSPRFPEKVGLAQFPAFSCSAGLPLMRPIAFMISCERFVGSGEYPMRAMFTCPSHAMYRNHCCHVSVMPPFEYVPLHVGRSPGLLHCVTM